MKRNLLLLLFFSITAAANAQFGFVKKADIEHMKDTRIVVVLNNDSAYNASIKQAVERYWNFNTGFIFAYDSAMKPYMKGEYSFLVFSRSKVSKIKAKVCLSEDDINGLVLTKKFKRKIPKDDLIAIGFCSNKIDTFDWYPEMVRGVQLLNNFCNLAIEGTDDRSITMSFMMNNYPTNKGVMTNQMLILEKKDLELKSKEDGPTIWDGEIDELTDREDIYKAIMQQDVTKVYYYSVLDEKYCNKLVVSASGSELMYFDAVSKEKCKCTSKDLKALKSLKDKSSTD